LVDKFIEDAIELDVDCLSDGETTVIGGMLEHIEFAGVHSATLRWSCRAYPVGRDAANVRTAPTRWRGAHVIG